eukprot:SAG31_NODE_7391_length_1702_cov_1.137867_2_plen_152_part_00
MLAAVETRQHGAPQLIECELIGNAAKTVRWRLAWQQTARGWRVNVVPAMKDSAVEDLVGASLGTGVFAHHGGAGVFSRCRIHHHAGDATLHHRCQLGNPKDTGPSFVDCEVFHNELGFWGREDLDALREKLQVREDIEQIETIDSTASHAL